MSFSDYRTCITMRGRRLSVLWDCGENGRNQPEAAVLFATALGILGEIETPGAREPRHDKRVIVFYNNMRRSGRVLESGFCAFTACRVARRRSVRDAIFARLNERRRRTSCRSGIGVLITIDRRSMFVEKRSHDQSVSRARVLLARSFDCGSATDDSSDLEHCDESDRLGCGVYYADDLASCEGGLNVQFSRPNGAAIAAAVAGTRWTSGTPISGAGKRIPRIDFSHRAGCTMDSTVRECDMVSKTSPVRMLRLER